MPPKHTLIEAAAIIAAVLLMTVMAILGCIFAAGAHCADCTINQAQNWETPHG